MKNERTATRIALLISALTACTASAQQPPFAGGLQGERSIPPLGPISKLQRDGTRTGMLEWARQANRAVRERLPMPVFASVTAAGGTQVTFFDAKAQPITLPHVGLVGLRSRFRYVFAIEGITARPNTKYYGSIEVVLGPWLPPMVSPPDAPVALAFSDQDVAALVNGAMITKIIVLENPATAAPVLGSPTEPLVYDTPDAEHAIEEAKRRGRIFMIVRVGDRQLAPRELIGLAADQSLFMPTDEGQEVAKKGGKLNLSHFRMVAGGSSMGDSDIMQTSYTGEAPAIPKGYSAPPCGPYCSPYGANCWPPFVPIAAAPNRPMGFVPFFDRYDDEWVCDGADRIPKVMVDNYNRVINVDPGDTIGAYKDHDGRRRFTESNLACVYSPRYVEVRAVQNVEGYERLLTAQRMRQNELMLGLAGAKHLDVRDQAEAVEGMNARMRPSGLVANAWVGVFSEVRILEGLEQAVGIHVDKQVQFALWLKNHEQLFVARNIEFAKTLTRAQSPVAVWSGMGIGQVLGSDTTFELRKVDVKPGRPARLVLEKTVDRPAAKPGEVVTFVLRYTNAGDEPMTSVAIMDSLAARLEYVPNTAKSTADAVFTAQENEAGSHTLRWEIKQPVNGKQGGLIEFQARLR